MKCHNLCRPQEDEEAFAGVVAVEFAVVAVVEAHADVADSVLAAVD